MGDIKVYSPSAIKAYAECPMKYELQYVDRYSLKQADRMFWGGVAGDGVDVGVGAIVLGKSLDEAQKWATTIMQQRVDAFVAAGGQLEIMDYQWVKDDVQVALTKFAKANPFERWTEIEVQKILEDKYGRPRIDVVGIDQHGVRAFADVKFKRYLDTNYVTKTVEDYRNDWQFQHYAWAMRATYGDPVNNYLCLVRLKSAWQAQLFEYVYHPDVLRMVGQSVERWSTMMTNSIEVGVPLGTVHSNKYGMCPYYDACFKYRFNEDAMQEKYIKIERTK